MPVTTTRRIPATGWKVAAGSEVQPCAQVSEYETIDPGALHSIGDWILSSVIPIRPKAISFATDADAGILCGLTRIPADRRRRYEQVFAGLVLVGVSASLIWIGAPLTAAQSPGTWEVDADWARLPERTAWDRPPGSRRPGGSHPGAGAHGAVF
jgi:hypothetical protein